MKCPRCGGQLFGTKYDEDKTCFQCGYILYRQIAKHDSVVKDLPNWGKGGAWVNKSVPTPDGIVMIDKRGVKYRVRSGRKRTGEWRNCIDCGRLIFVRSHRKGTTQGKRCAPCNRKAYPPPRRKTGQST